MRFEGTTGYIAGDELAAAVNVAVALERPLLIRGEPGTGKTLLAEAVSEALGLELLVWGVKSTTRAQDGLYVYDTVQRLYDSQFGDGDPSDIARYIRLGRLGRGLRVARAGGAADRRGRQGRPGVPERPAVGARPHELPHPRDRPDGERRAPPGGDHHLQRREGAARRLPAPVRLPLHRVPRPGADGGDRPGAPPRPGRPPDRRGDGGLLRAALVRRAAEAADHERADRLGAGAGRSRAYRPSACSPSCRSSAWC